MKSDGGGRVRHPLVRRRLADAEEAARLVRAGDVLGVSGFARAGSPKAVPRALARLADSGGGPTCVFH